MQKLRIITLALSVLSFGAVAQQAPAEKPAIDDRPATPQPAFPSANAIAAKPRLQADGKNYVVDGVITQVIDGHIILRHFTDEAARFFGSSVVAAYGGNWTAVLRLTGRAGDQIRNTASIGGKVTVVGRYATNLAFSMANGERATLAAFDVVEVVRVQ